MTKGTDQIDRRQFIGGAAALGASALLPACRSSTGIVTGPKSAAGQLDGFGVSEAQVRQVMAKAMGSGAEFCDLFFQRKESNYLGLEDQAVNRAYSRSELGVGVRVVRGVETGYAYTESLDLPSMLQAAEVAAAVANGPARPSPQSLRVGKHPSFYPLKTQWSKIPTSDKVSRMMAFYQLAAAEDKRIQKINISYRDEESHVLVIDSQGQMLYDYQPMVVCYLSCVAEQKGKRESNYVARAARADLSFLDDSMLKEAAQQAVARTTILFDAVAGPVGELPVVLGPGSSGILLHEAIGHGMEADFARKKTTVYTDKVGKSIAPKHVTIVDDGTNPGLRGSINFDDEGNPSKRTTLVENGVLQTFLHDRVSARHFNVEPTGSGRRQSFRHMPLPRMRNTYMLNGPHKPEEIIRSVKKGIYAEHFTNGQVDIGPGDFSFYVKNGMLIEDGKMTKPIKDVNIIGNGPKVLEAVAMVGDDFRLDNGGWTCGKSGQSVPVGLGMPTVKVGRMTIGGSKRS